MLTSRRAVLADWLRWMTAAAGTGASACAMPARPPMAPAVAGGPATPPGVDVQRVIDVRTYGATGDGTTDDTEALRRAVAAFEQSCTAAPAAKGACVLHLPAGAYRISDTIVVSGVIGGIIQGDGELQSRLVGDRLGGKPAMLRLENCAYTTVKYLEGRPENQFVELAGDVPVGSRKVRVRSAADLGPGRRIALASRDRATAELLTVAAVADDTVTTTTPVLHSYVVRAAGESDVVATGVFSVFQSYGRRDRPAPTATRNVFEHCRAGFDSAFAALVGFSTDCLGGGPTYTTRPARAGDHRLVVFDAGSLFVGARLQLWFNSWTSGETVVVSAIDENEVALTQPLVYGYPERTIVISDSDANNELHTFASCEAVRCVVAGWDIGHLNSLENQIIASQVDACPAGIRCVKGGSFSVLGLALNASEADLVLGGPMVHAVKLCGVLTESGSKMLFAHPSYRLSMLNLDIVNYDKVGGPSGTGQPLIDLSGSGMVVNISQCNLSLGARLGQLEVMMSDPSGTSQLNLNGGCNLGCYGYTLDGVAMKDVGSTWTGARPLVERLSNGATVRAIFATYGSDAACSIRRSPSSTVALSAGVQHDLALPAAGQIEVSGAEGPVTITGFRPPGADATVERELVFEFAHRVTIAHLGAGSAPAHRVHCPGGRDLVLEAPGAVRLKRSAALAVWIVLSHT
jgi:hypothetical protein